MSEIESPKTFNLICPLTISGNHISSLTLREPTAGDLDYAESNSKTANGVTIQLLALMAQKDVSVIKELSLRDYTVMSRYLKSFLQYSPQTGKSN